jgi:hypothetical protein
MTAQSMHSYDNIVGSGPRDPDLDHIDYSCLSFSHDGTLLHNPLRNPLPADAVRRRTFLRACVQGAFGWEAVRRGGCSW